MKIKYEFVNGEAVEIEVDEKWGNILMEMDEKEKRNNRKETRRHESFQDEGEWAADEFRDPAYIYESAIEEERLDLAYSQLSDDQQELVWNLFELDKSGLKVAEEKGITHQAVTRRVERIQKKIKKFL